MLVLTLVLCTVLAVVAVALAGYAAAALRSSAVTDGRTNTREAAEAGLRVGVEQLQLGSLACGIEPVPLPASVNGAVITLGCRLVDTGPFDYQTVELESVATAGRSRSTAVARVQHSASLGWTAVNSWEVR